MQTAVLVFVQRLVEELKIRDMKKKLTSQLNSLLLDVVHKQQLASVSIDKVQAGTLTDEERRIYLDALSREFCETGLGPDDEPNERGLLLESLIDFLNPIN